MVGGQLRVYGSYDSDLERHYPGAVHNILRAETFALYQVLRFANRPDVYIDNSTVVFHANEVLTHGFHPSSWESRADGDLWSLVAAEMVSTPKDSIRVLKVKAHSSLEDAVDSFHQWLVAGNAAADSLAKATLTTYLKENKAESRSLHETTTIDDAFVCSRLLHQISLHVRDTIKESPAMDTRQDTLDSRPVENLPSEDVRPWQLDKVAHFNPPTWDEIWLQLVQYFSLLQWPELEQRNPTPISPGGNHARSLSDVSDGNASPSRKPEADIPHFPEDL